MYHAFLVLAVLQSVKCGVLQIAGPAQARARARRAASARMLPNPRRPARRRTPLFCRFTGFRPRLLQDQLISNTLQAWNPGAQSPAPFARGPRGPASAPRRAPRAARAAALLGLRGAASGSRRHRERRRGGPAGGGAATRLRARPPPPARPRRAGWRGHGGLHPVVSLRGE